MDELPSETFSFPRSNLMSCSKFFEKMIGIQKQVESRFVPASKPVRRSMPRVSVHHNQ
jgi:hypothetical protein